MELKFFKCKFYGTSISVTTEGVEICPGKYSSAIPFDEIQEVFFPNR